MSATPNLNFGDDDFIIHFEDLEIGPKVGEGQFSTVFAARYIGEPVAVKKQTRNTKALERYLERELAALKHLQHENLVEFYGAANIHEAVTTANLKLPQPFAVYIVTEFAEGGDLLNLLTRKEVPLGWKLRMRIMKDAAAGLHYMHSKGLIHRDIKSSNFLLDRHWRCKISDFGMARDLTNQRMTICGTDEYMAPEIMLDEVMAYPLVLCHALLLGQPYSTPIDIFSYGMVLLEVLARRKAAEDGFAHRPVTSMFRLDTDKVRTQLPEDCPPSLVELAVQCVAYESADRPDAESVLGWIDDLHLHTQDDGLPDPPLPPVPDFPQAQLDPGKTMSMTRTARQASTEAKAGEAGRKSPKPAIDDVGYRPSSMDKTSREALAAHEEEPEPGAPPRPIVVAGGGSHTMLHGGGDAAVPSMEGYLQKRKTNGFRIWKRRYVVLQGGELTWFDRPHGELRGHMSLHRHSVVIRDRRFFKWAVMDAQQHCREFAAPSNTVMVQWVAALNSAIEYANARVSSPPPPPPPSTSPSSEALMALTRKSGSGLSPTIAGGGSLYSIGSSTGTSAAAASHLSMTVRPDIQDVSHLLSSLSLSELLPRFQQKGYTDMARLVDLGLTDQDLDYLGIDSPLTRRLLRSALDSNYSESVRVEVLGHVQLGDAIFYKVKSRWHMWRSIVYLGAEDLKALHTELTAAMKEKGRGETPHQHQHQHHHHHSSHTTADEATGQAGIIPPLPQRHERAAILFKKADHKKVMPTKDSMLEEWFQHVGETLLRLTQGGRAADAKTTPTSTAAAAQALNVLLAALDLNR